jgi:hypothetical protein
MTQKDILKVLGVAWPAIQRELEAHPSTVLKRRPVTYTDKKVFQALLLYVWRGLPIRQTLGNGYPDGSVLHRRWRIWMDSSALKPMVTAFAQSLPKPMRNAWADRLGVYDSQLRLSKSRNPPMAWLMVNRFWHEAVAVPFLEAGPCSGRPDS